MGNPPAKPSSDQLKLVPDPRTTPRNEQSNLVQDPRRLAPGNEPVHRNQLPKGLENQNNMAERNRSPSPLRTENSQFGQKSTVTEKFEAKSNNKPSDNYSNQNQKAGTMDNTNNTMRKNETSPQKPKSSNEGIMNNSSERNRSVSPLNNYESQKEKAQLQSQNEKNRSVSPINESSKPMNNERNRSFSPLPVVNQEKKIVPIKDDNSMQRNNQSQAITAKFASSEKFTSSDRFESKTDMRNLNESMIPVADPNYSMQNDSTSEYLIKELSSQKKMASSKTVGNKGMSSIKEQNEEDSKVFSKNKKQVKSTFASNDEPDRNTKISHFLDGIMKEMKIEDKPENKILNSLFDITRSDPKRVMKDSNNQSLDKINQEILQQPPKKKADPPTQKKPIKNLDKPMEESQKNRNELTFMEKQQSAQKTGKTNTKTKHDSGSDEVGNEASEEETSRRNTALQRNMEENINRSKSQTNKFGKEDWMNPEEESLNDMDNYFKQFDTAEKSQKNQEEDDDLPKFGKKDDFERNLERKIGNANKKGDMETHLDKKITERFSLEEEEHEDKFNFVSKKIEKKPKKEENDNRGKKEKNFESLKFLEKKEINKKPQMQEPLEIPDSDIDKGFLKIFFKE